MRNLVCRCLSLVAALTAAGVVSSAEQPYVVAVQPGASIQAAINAAPAGAVIVLGAGEWQEALTIDKSLTLRGAGADKTTLRARGSDSAVVAANDGGVPGVEFVLEDLAVTGARRGVWLDGSLRARLTRVTVFDCVGTYGVFIDGTVTASLTDCTITANDEFGVGTGAFATASLVACTLRDNGTTDATLLESSRVTMLDCSLGGSTKGVWVYSKAQATLVSCSFSGNAIALTLRDLGQATVIACRIADARRSAVLLQGTSKLTMFGCTIASCQAGLDLQDSTRALLASCRVNGSTTYGVSLQESATALLYGSDITGSGTIGVQLLERPCVETSARFTGRVFGRGNRIPDPTDALGIGNVGICPEGLSFLTTEQGGVLDRRPPS